MSGRAAPGDRFRTALDEERPLQVVGVINAYAALLAERAGFRAIYLSGAGVANASRGMADLGMTTLEDVLTDVRRIAAATDLPLLVDADTGWDDAAGVAHTVREMISAGAAGMHLEDQVPAKRCGHRPGKVLVSADEMTERIRVAVDARTDPAFVIMARTDAAAVEGLEAAIGRARQYREAGADMIFAEAFTDLGQYRALTVAVDVPVLANITEFGQTPLYTTRELLDAGVRLVLYPLSAFRAMSAAAEQVYGVLRRDGTQRSILGRMQTRDALYEVLGYHQQERALDQQMKENQDDES